MPKTPSMKQRGKKRAKQKIDVINENDSQQQGSPATAKMLPTKLKFERWVHCVLFLRNLLTFGLSYQI